MPRRFSAVLPDEITVVHQGDNQTSCFWVTPVIQDHPPDLNIWFKLDCTDSPQTCWCTHSGLCNGLFDGTHDLSPLGFAVNISITILFRMHKLSIHFYLQITCDIWCALSSHIHFIIIIFFQDLFLNLPELRPVPSSTTIDDLNDYRHAAIEKSKRF